jgi:hypothetical protein
MASQFPPFVAATMTTAQRDAAFPNPPHGLIIYCIDAVGTDVDDGRLQMYEMNRGDNQGWHNFLLTEDRLQFPDAFFNMGETFEDVTINATGEVTATRTHLRVDTYEGAAIDNLDSIIGGSPGDWLVLVPASAARTVVLRHRLGGNSSPIMEDGSDLPLTEGTEVVVLLRSGIGWHVVGRGSPHNRQHDHADAPGGGTIAHSDLTGATSSDHHTKYTEAEATRRPTGRASPRL